MGIPYKHKWDGYCSLLYAILVFPRAITDSFNVFLHMQLEKHFKDDNHLLVVRDFKIITWKKKQCELVEAVIPQTSKKVRLFTFINMPMRASNKTTQKLR